MQPSWEQEQGGCSALAEILASRRSRGGPGCWLQGPGQREVIDAWLVPGREGLGTSTGTCWQHPALAAEFPKEGCHVTSAQGSPHLCPHGCCAAHWGERGTIASMPW